MPEAPIERLPASAYMNWTEDVYEDAFGLFDYFKPLSERGCPTILVGPKGIGKTLSVNAYAKSLKCPIITYDCSEDTRRGNLVGLFSMRGDTTPFVLGPLTAAIETANEHGSCILCLEEINALIPGIQKGLNPIADFRKKIEVPEVQRVFSLNKGASLWVVGTMVDSSTSGTFQINEDLRSRFRFISIPYPKSKIEKKIVKKVLPEMEVTYIDRVLRFAKETRQEQLDFKLSTRDVVQILSDIRTMGVDKALTLARSKFDTDDLSLIDARIESIFGEITTRLS